MSKKNKKNKKNPYAITPELQQALLEKQNEDLERELKGEDPLPLEGDIADDYECDKTVEEMGDAIFKMLNERKKDRELEGEDGEIHPEDETPPEPEEEETEPEPVEPPVEAQPVKKDVSDIIQSTDDKPDKEMEEYNDMLEQRLENEAAEEGDDEEEGQFVQVDPSIGFLSPALNQEMILHQITFTHYMTDAFNIVSIADGIRNFTIDLNTLPQDEFKLPNTETLNTMTIALMRLEEILPCFYPGMIMSKDRLNSTMRHVSEVSDDNFSFFEYPDGNSNLVVGYYISEKMLETYMNIIKTLEERGCVIGFLNAIYDMAMTIGFAFNLIPVEGIRQISLTHLSEISTKEFIDVLMNNDDTVEDEDHFNESVDSVIRILPYDFMDEEIDEILNPSDDDGEDAPITEFSMPSEVYENTDEEESGDEPAAEEVPAPEEGSDLFDGVEGVEEEPDPEEAVKQYYASKGQKPPKEQPKKKKKDDDINWVIPRR